MTDTPEHPAAHALRAAASGHPPPPAELDALAQRFAPGRPGAFEALDRGCAEAAALRADGLNARARAAAAAALEAISAAWPWSPPPVELPTDPDELAEMADPHRHHRARPTPAPDETGTESESESPDTLAARVRRY